jgi:hypothetical protein
MKFYYILITGMFQPILSICRVMRTRIKIQLQFVKKSHLTKNHIIFVGIHRLNSKILMSI